MTTHSPTHTTENESAGHGASRVPCLCLVLLAKFSDSNSPDKSHCNNGITETVDLPTPCPICGGELILFVAKHKCACRTCWNAFIYPSMKELGILGEVKS